MADKIILFDGACTLCSRCTHFLIKHNQKNEQAVFKLASQQSLKAKPLLQQHRLNASELNSVIYIENNKAYTNTDAILAIFKHFPWPYKGVLLLRFIPRSIRDFFYSHIAKNRHKLFGTSCFFLSQQERKKHFL